MTRARIIPLLLLENRGLYKTKKFSDAKYVGDPLNAVKIFNEKQCDELIILDISASKKRKKPDFALIKEIASECFMPLAYGGGIETLQDIETILKSGIEKVILNTVLIANPSFLKEASKAFASSTLVASVDIRKNIIGKALIHSHTGLNIKFTDPLEFSKHIEDQGAGEIMINSIDRDGMMIGYDLHQIKKISDVISIPLIAAGGCRDLADIHMLFNETNASAAAAGSFFVFHGKHRAVLISYPSPEEIDFIKVL
ncbi:MAG: AglZ/HisF2 family acetamidino modification protein [Sphingobacteriales bacterium]|jgi:cyclase|nr:AglZ/HisF2 family acetamidino modification protein [Sphingobacteriales bacterium]